jgi:hypothetical protein
MTLNKEPFLHVFECGDGALGTRQENFGRTDRYALSQCAKYLLGQLQGTKRGEIASGQSLKGI